MTALNLSFPSAASIVDVPTLFAYVNTLSSGYFAILGLLVLWLVTFIILKKNESRIVVTTASFVTSLVAILLFFAAVTTQATVWVCVVILLISIFIDVWKGGDEG